MENERKTEASCEESKQEKAVKKADARVGRLNRIFDRLILPMIGFTVTLAIFAALFGGSCMDSCAGKLLADGPAADTENGAAVSVNKDFYQKRDKIMSKIDENRDLLTQNGFIVSDQYDENLAARKNYDDDTYSIDYFADGKCRAILRQNAGEDADYISVVLGIYSEGLVTVDLSAGDRLYLAAFTDDGFISPSPNNIDAAEKILEIVPREYLRELLAMYKDAWTPVLG